MQPPIRQLGTPSKPTGDSQPVIPPAYRPPPGMCRIWLDAVPPQQQPAPTDCASAVRNRPNNGHVIFGDDYVDRRDNRKDKDKDKKPSSDEVRAAATGVRPADLSSDDAPIGFGRLRASRGLRIHGPQADETISDAFDARLLDEPGVAAFAQPPAPRPRATSPIRPRVAPGDTVDDRRAASDRRSGDDRRGDDRRGDGRQPRRDSTRDDVRDGVRNSVRGGSVRGYDDRYDNRYDGRDGRSDRRYDDRYDSRSGDRRYDDRYDSRYDDRYDSRYDDRYDDRDYGSDRRYAPPGRANGTCLDRDRDGWCDDSRTGAGYCRDIDGDGRCDDYPGLASAPYASALPPMRAATDVQRGRGSEAALRWLGTAEVSVRTSELKRTGTPYRAMWLDANTGRLIQVWTDRDGDGIADRVEIYRNGRIVKTIGR